MNFTLLRIVVGYILLVAALLAFSAPDHLPLIVFPALLASFFILFTPPQVVASGQARRKHEWLIFLAGLAVALLIPYLSGWSTVRDPAIRPNFLIFLWLVILGASRDLRACKKKATEEPASVQ